MTEQRLIDIEIKLAHHEHTIAELNQALSDQQAQLTRLEALCKSLAEKVRSQSGDLDMPPQDERPPHY